ncbi:sensor histidine kinase [Halobaculum sp. EA56]|uniref:sensor histidine kinase n=1 Tax=Halobaculum sp. EA56 TaxID=3421648 RepID=UPI003EBE54E1
MSKCRAETIEALHHAATTIQAEETVEGVCERTVSAAAEILEFNLCTVLVREDDWLVPYAVSEDAPPDGSRRMRIDQGMAGETYRTGESRVVGEITPTDGSDPADESYRSGISIPIVDRGVFQAVSTTTHAFGDDEIELAELLVSHTGTAIGRIERERELERQNERLDRFVSAVSHDLRNPLNVATGRLDLVAEECDSPHLEDVANAHRRMERLIEDLLAYARAGTESIDRTTVDLSEAFAESWSTLGADGATLTVETDRRIHADADRFRQLAENLLTNAIQHGGTAVTVGDLDGGFYVEDDGEGISKSEYETVFDAGVTTREVGSGFGLSIVEQVVDGHGWEIRVTDGSEGGARFEITGVDVVDRV